MSYGWGSSRLELQRIVAPGWAFGMGCRDGDECFLRNRPVASLASHHEVDGGWLTRPRHETIRFQRAGPRSETPNEVMTRFYPVTPTDSKDFLSDEQLSVSSTAVRAKKASSSED